MDGWIVLGELYVKPIDWDELWLVEPDGVEYAAYRHHVTNDQRILVGTGSTPARAARLITQAVRTASGGVVDQDETRRNHGLPPRDARGRRARERADAERLQAAQEEAARIARERRAVPARARTRPLSVQINDLAETFAAAAEASGMAGGGGGGGWGFSSDITISAPTAPNVVIYDNLGEVNEFGEVIPAASDGANPF